MWFDYVTMATRTGNCHGNECGRDGDRPDHRGRTGDREGAEGQGAGDREGQGTCPLCPSVTLRSKSNPRD